MNFILGIFAAIHAALSEIAGILNRRHKGLFGTDGRRTFESKPIKGHQDPWSMRRAGLRNPFKESRSSFPPKSGGRNLPKDFWEEKYKSFIRGSVNDSPSSNPITDEYYGHKGEFDTNDSILARLEDMEQFAAIDKELDASEHGYDWDEIIDAVNDGYLPQDHPGDPENLKG